MTSPYCLFSSKLLGYSTLLDHYCSGQGCKEIAFNASLVFLGFQSVGNYSTKVTSFDK